MLHYVRSNELQHHGIKGQKWGKRNGPPYPLAPEDHSAAEKKAKWYYSLNRNTNEKSALKKVSDNTTRTGRLSFRKSKKESGNASKASSKTASPTKERLLSPIKKAGLMSSHGIHTSDIRAHKLFTARPLGDKGIRVKTGDIVQHIMSTPVKDMTNRDYLFVAATEADKKNYGGFFAALTKYRNGVDQMYKMEMTAMTDIVSPSKKERVNTFLEIYKEDPVRVATQLAEFNKRNYGGQYKETTEQLVKKYSNMSMRELKNMGYYTYANSWFDPEAGTLKDMRSRLEKKGYNAIIDDNDKRSFVQSQAPLIVFNVMNNFGDVKVSKLTTGEMRRNMIDWQNMKHSEDECPMENRELYHWGVKGMKWGVRRYQNKDGTLTPAGLKRRERDTSEMSDKKKKQYKESPSKWVKEDMERSKRLADASSNLTNQLKQVNDRKMKDAPKAKMDLSSMTDKQMRDEINRALLERQYNDMFAPQKTSKGREYASKILEGAGGALAITSSALGVALAIKELTGK